MTQNQFYIYFAVLALIIFVLGLGVSFFYLKIKKIEAEQEKIKRDYLHRENERATFVKDSLLTISKAYLQGQVDPSETCIRLRMLIDRVDFIDNDRFPQLFSMYEEIRYFKTHEARNTLSRAEKNEEDRQRFAIEDKYKDNLTNECKLLVNFLEEQ